MSVIPPLESGEQALRLPEVAAIYAKARGSSRPGAMTELNLALLLAALHDGGVTLGAYDGRKALWLAGWEPELCAAVAGWIGRAHAAGREDDGDG